MFLTGFDDTDLQTEQVRQREDIRQLQEKLAQFQNDVRAAQTENESFKSEISRLKIDLASSQQAQIQFQKEIERLDGLIKKLDAARQQDRKTIVEEVGKEIARMIKTSSPSTTKSRSENPREKTSKPAVEEGLEHIVSKGESLFAIAEAYGVTVKSIKEANQLKTNELRVGQKLFIPKK